MNEFQLIQSHLARLAGPEGLNLRDDVALWRPPFDQEAVFSADTLIEGVHFPGDKFDYQVAQKLMRTNVSDIVAKGADPVGYLLSLALNSNVDETHIKDFCAGLAADQVEFGLKLWGGDTTRTDGPNVLTVTIIGTAPIETMVRRSDARPGDVVCVTNTIGDSYLGLKLLLKQIDKGKIGGNNERLTTAYHVPNPPFKARHSIRKYAHAAMDISDGLIADAGHLATASGVEITINLDDIPVSEAAQSWLNNQPEMDAAMIRLATGGDDYQVLMTIDPTYFDDLSSELTANGITCTQIGHVKEGNGVRALNRTGQVIDIEKPGYAHF